MTTLTPPPYNEAYTYMGPDDAFVSLSWYSLYTRKYEREKIRLGIKGLGTDRKKVLLNELEKK